MSVLIVARTIVGLTFASAVTPKIFNYSAIVAGIETYSLAPRGSGRILAPLLISLELVVAFTHILGILLWFAVPLTFAMLGLFTCATLIELGRGRSTDCLCFSVGSRTVTVATVFRSTALVGVELLAFRARAHVIASLASPEATLALFTWTIILTSIAAIALEYRSIATVLQSGL